MYKTYEEAKKAAIETINELYPDNKMGCVITETKLTKRSRKTFFGFRFHDIGTDGKFIQNEYGEYVKKTEL